MSEPKHKPGTCLFDIIQDGWSRGFGAKQIKQEAEACGYKIDKKSIKKFKTLMEKEMDLHFRLSGLEK